MKTLTKFKLINWHLFSNQTAFIEDNTVLTGQNGSGKSTILDAFQYLLLGGRSGAKFNAAADEKNRRDLYSYVRGRIGAVDKEFLRQGEVTCHIVLEFFDNFSNQYTLIGVIVELPQGGTQSANCKERFYILNNQTLEEDIYVDGKYPRTYMDMKRYLQNKSIELKPLDKGIFRQAISEYLGIDASKYAKLLPKALGVKEMNVNNFIFEFFLDDEPVDVSSLKNNVSELKKVELQIKQDISKLEILNKIVDSSNRINESKSSKTTNEIIEKMITISSSQDSISRNEEEISTLDNKILDYQNKRNLITEKIQNLDDQKHNLERARDNDDSGSLIADYNRKLTVAKNQLENEQNQVLKIKELINNEAYIVNSIKNDVKTNSITDFSKYIASSGNEYSSSELIVHLNKCLTDISHYSTHIADEFRIHEDKKKELSSNIGEIKTRLNKLSNNEKPIPFNVLSLIKILKEELTDKYNEEVNVFPLCDLVDVLEPKWRNACEGSVGGSRFDIFLEPKYFDSAVKIFERVRMEKGIYNCGIVNTSKFANNIDANPLSLSAKISSNYDYARNYIYNMFNNIICVERSEELKNHNRSITPSCMTYSNHTVRQISPKQYETPYLGSEAASIQKDLEIKDLELNQAEFVKVSSEVESIKQKLDLVNKSNMSKLLNSMNLSVLESVKETKQTIITLDEQIESQSATKDIAQIELKLRGINQKRAEIEREKTDIERESSICSYKKEEIIKSITRIKEQLVTYTQELNDLSNSNPSLFSLASSSFEEYKVSLKSNFDLIYKEISRQNSSLTQLITKLHTEAISSMRYYNSKYFFNAVAEIDSIQLYIEEANRIEKNDLANYRIQASQLRKECEEIFHEEFLSKLRAAISKAQGDIDNLNYSLKDKWFGEDQYELVYSPSKDPEYTKYYNIIMKNEVMEKNGLYSAILNKEEESAMKELFEVIASTDSELSKYSQAKLDYRNYLSYDIKIVSRNNDVMYLGNDAGSKSGGEQQSPFYILIAACFDQLMTKNTQKNAGCLVLFDEAFNKMDNIRIPSLLNFYRSLSIQLMIAVPPNKLNDIRPHTKTCLVVIKEKNSLSRIGNFNDLRDSRPDNY